MRWKKAHKKRKNYLYWQQHALRSPAFKRAFKRIQDTITKNLLLNPSPLWQYLKDSGLVKPVEQPTLTLDLYLEKRKQWLQN